MTTDERLAAARAAQVERRKRWKLLNRNMREQLRPLKLSGAGRGYRPPVDPRASQE